MTETITLGKTSIRVAPLGIGTWAWGDSFFWSYGKDYHRHDVQDAFRTAIKSGITLFDTAEVYGNGESERLIGQFNQENPQSITVATKYAPFPWRWTKQSVSDAITASLNRLQVKHIPLYQVHWPFMLMSQNTLMNALADEVEQGRIGAVGVSNYSAAEMKQASEILASRNIPLAVNQVKYSLLTRKIEHKGITKVAKELGITLLAYSPLAQGLLTGKYNLEQPTSPEGARKLDSRFKPGGLQKIAPVINLLTQIGAKYGKTPAQVALNWLICQGNVIPIPGAKTAQQAIENAGALGWKLTPEEVAQLAEVTSERMEN
jgi:aryl-alcohol dehydrogenase-like predicted oxidoreductase